MNAQDLTRVRLWTQQISQPRFQKPEQVVAALGAIQAQDFGGAKWSIGLRMPDGTEAEVDRAIAERKIVRTWPMRGTLHFVAAEDARWMLTLLAPRIIAGSENRRLELELDAKVFKKTTAVLTRALQGGRCLTRESLHVLFEKEKVTMSPQRSYHVFWKHAQEGLICFGAHEGKQPTFALLEEWIAPVQKRDREEALAELAKRYFTGHGPATLQDFVWWTGLKVTDARSALDSIASQLMSEVVDEKTYWMSPAISSLEKLPNTSYLLPGFDEYMLGYTDRSAALEPRFAQKICPGSNGVFANTLVIAGKVVGTWKRTVKKATTIVTPTAFTSLSKAHLKALAAPVQRYGKYLGTPAKLSSSL